jgi:hypothetical protein
MPKLVSLFAFRRTTTLSDFFRLCGKGWCTTRSARRIANIVFEIALDLFLLPSQFPEAGLACRKPSAPPPAAKRRGLLPVEGRDRHEDLGQLLFYVNRTYCRYALRRCGSGRKGSPTGHKTRQVLVKIVTNISRSKSGTRGSAGLAQDPLVEFQPGKLPVPVSGIVLSPLSVAKFNSQHLIK